MTAKASTKYKVGKKAIRRYLADRDLTQRHLAVPQAAVIDDMPEMAQNG